VSEEGLEFYSWGVRVEIQDLDSTDTDRPGRGDVGRVCGRLGCDSALSFLADERSIKPHDLPTVRRLAQCNVSVHSRLTTGTWYR